MIKAVIFDMDGVISDTQQFHSKIESSVLFEYGISMSPEEIVTQYAGTKDSVFFAEVFKKNGVSADIGKAINRKWKLMEEITKNKIKPIPAVLEFINKLHKSNYLLSVASGSPTHFILTVLSELRIKSKFSVLTSGDEVAHGKPDPEIFLLSAKKLQVAPENCVVIEDSINGVKAAKRAGMECIAILTTSQKSKLSEADLIIDSFEDFNVGAIKSF